MSEEFWLLMGVGLPVAGVWMMLAWLLARWRNNAAVGDAAWALGFALLAAVDFSFGDGGERKLLLCAMTAIWSLRLGGYLAVRLAKTRSEGGRLALLRERFPRHTWLLFFGWFELQAVLLAALGAPLAIVASDSRDGLTAWHWAGAALWLVGMLGEALADYELLRFRARGGQGVCRSGLWRWSRHPNYFFTTLVWGAFAIFALGSPGGWLALSAPLLVLISLLGAPGISALEAHSVATRGEAYREYQSATSPFVPWFSRRR
jgi:steroid 5-alpha reductase family enzyme